VWVRVMQLMPARDAKAAAAPQHERLPPATALAALHPPPQNAALLCFTNCVISFPSSPCKYEAAQVSRAEVAQES
jgi:hypothetical protein